MSATSIELKAPAKLNLFLHVVGRRTDGMHLLESVFVLIDLCDDIVLELDPSGKISRTGDVIGDMDKDLCVRAARRLQQISGTTIGCRIHVTKRIPAGAGMGGGSSDCASTLMGLNKLWGLNWPQEKLMSIGESLGADVPFFLFGQNAFAQGTGGILMPIAVPQAWVAVAMPSKPTSTALIFRHPALTRDTKSLKISALSQQLSSQWPELIGRNDLQPVAVRINPEIGKALQALGSGARMTGSGSAVFALFGSEESAKQALEAVSYPMRGYVTKILQEHPSVGCLVG